MFGFRAEQALSLQQVERLFKFEQTVRIIIQKVQQLLRYAKWVTSTVSPGQHQSIACIRIML